MTVRIADSRSCLSLNIKEKRKMAEPATDVVNAMCVGVQPILGENIQYIGLNFDRKRSFRTPLFTLPSRISQRLQVYQVRVLQR